MNARNFQRELDRLLERLAAEGRVPRLFLHSCCAPCSLSLIHIFGHAAAGATVIVNCSASSETTGKDSYREALINGQSARLICGYIYANAGDGESTQDLVFGGQNIIAENGTCLAQSKRFVNETIYADLDLERLEAERRRMTTYQTRGREEDVYKRQP